MNEPTNQLPPDDPAVGRLHDYVIVRFEGADAATFLQGYATCDTDKLQPEQAAATAFCNLQGRVVANGWLWGTSDSVKLLTHSDCGELLASFLKPYLNFSRSTVHIDDAPPAAAIGDGTALPIALDGARSIDDSPPQANAPDSDLSTAWRRAAIELNEVWVDATTTASFLPQMLGLTDRGAVNFEKGCYLGQEVVARAQHRGKVKRQLQRARIPGNQLPVTGTELLDSDGKKCGVVVASAPDGDGATAGALQFVGPQQELGSVEWHSADEVLKLDLY